MKVMTENTIYQDIADALREKTGSTTDTTYYPHEMASVIRGLTLDAKCNLVVQTELGSIVAAHRAGEETQYPTERNGIYVFGEMASGEWTVTARSADGTKEVSRLIKIYEGQPGKMIRLFYGPKINDLTVRNLGSLNVDYAVQYDNGDPIPEADWDEAVNWRILIYKSGSIAVSKECNVDIFCVGGGGAGGGAFNTSVSSGGGGGYTKTVKNVVMYPNEEYPIYIGLGGIGHKGSNNTTGGQGGTTYIGNLCSAMGGFGGKDGRAGEAGIPGGNGGSGGGAPYYNGGSGGGNGLGNSGFGEGQGSPTTEFGESNNYLYSGGGGGYGALGGKGGGGNGGNANANGGAGVANTGGGGGGCYGSSSSNDMLGGSGGSGIIVIRNTRAMEEIDNE